MAAPQTPPGGASQPPHVGDPTAHAGETAGEILTEKTLTYRIVRLSVSVTLRTLFRARFAGAEHLPPRGGALIAANHQSYLDIPLVASATLRHVSFVARDTLAETRALGWLMRQCGAVLIRRGKPDRQALREMVAHLEAGDVVCVFPEGTRSPDGSVGAFRGGALLAARLARVPIVPVGVRGTFDAWPRGRRPRLARVALSFGAPLDPLAADAEVVRAKIVELAGDGR
jgi:1-acyl-sn-glycerol-3-phosphate acyltransferase